VRARLSFLLISLLVSTSAGAKSPEASSLAHSTIDRGFLTTSSPDFILRVDLRSGSAVLKRLTNSESSTPISFSINADQGTLADLEFLLLGGANGNSTKAACETQAGNVTTAATLVSNTCTAGTPTLACTSAIEAFNEAVNSFRDCIRNFQAEK